ncbi:DUF2937 family protein [Litorilituus lipolyticus]|uniref:DUF2937 family protein n=1 Tax=Litorilituus lipolyticus TaxID=2491017 RepID=A0A502L2I6_9GAMM|nr:DUF2937 family protein [Litorilituus lipolyticus]TPH18148.1 DUF2937 family protein [Litorilituus lipolyticus]
MIARLIDKLIFGTSLIIALQVPQLAEHYQQFLSGLYQATKWQVDGYQITADKYEYDSIRAMIDHHLSNDVLSVRADATQKLVTLEKFEQLTDGLELFKQGNLLEKSYYMFQPKRVTYLKETLANFSLGIPLTFNGILFGIVVGLLINLLITGPITLIAKRVGHAKSPDKIKKHD